MTENQRNDSVVVAHFATSQYDALPFHCDVKQDRGPKPGCQGRIPGWAWAYKQAPGG